jgi:magnesium-protoporphyrin O-methyltransferase
VQRKVRAVTESAQHKAQLRDYFDGIGFERWAAIYGHDELGRVRRTIRAGHGAMLAQAALWLAESFPTVPSGATALDAGCGTGLWSIALARRGFHVTAIDIAPQMVDAAMQAATRAGVRDRITFLAGDLELVSGSYDVVSCFDVLVHYPQALFAPLATRLAQLSNGPLLLTYAPYNRLLAGLHWVGGRFPRSQRRQDIQMIRQAFVEDTLRQAGMEPSRSARISSGFYHVTLLEAQPNTSQIAD